jgi:hypothetical protein
VKLQCEEFVPVENIVTKEALEAKGEAPKEPNSALRAMLEDSLGSEEKAAAASGN